MSRLPLEYLRHILDECAFIGGRIKGITQDEFMRDETAKRAVVRSLEVIGEAAKQMPEEFRKEHSEVEWRAMAAMRDRLIHGYFGVDYEIVWDAASNKVPALGSVIERIILEAGDKNELN